MVFIASHGAQEGRRMEIMRGLPCPQRENLPRQVPDEAHPRFCAILTRQNHIPVAEDVLKTAVTIPFGLYEFQFITIDLGNAAQTFQRFMDEVLQGLDFCYAYIDDILVASASPEEHLQHLETVFQRLREYGVVINSMKCVFG